jgi:hypothetical protein
LQAVGADKEVKADAQMVFDFTGDKLQDQWITVNDDVMGGRSKGGFSFKKGKLIFAGSTNTNGGGFSSIRTKQVNLNLNDKEGVIIRYKGDGRTYKFDVRMGRSSVAHRAEFKTVKNSKGWQIVKIPFSDMTATWRGSRLDKRRYALEIPKIQSLGFMIYDKKDGPFELRVDWIKDYSNGE